MAGVLNILMSGEGGEVKYSTGVKCPAIFHDDKWTKLFIITVEPPLSKHLCPQELILCTDK